MRPAAAVLAVAALLLVPAAVGASSTTRFDVSPRHGHRYSTYTVSFRAEFPASSSAQSRYVLGAVNSAPCARGVSSFGRVSTRSYRIGATVRFVLRAPRHGWCPGVFHGVGHWQKREGDRWRDVRTGRFAFRVLSG